MSGRHNPTPERPASRARGRRRAAFVMQDPYAAVEKGWYNDPEFLIGFFDRCEDIAFLALPETLELALRANQLADLNGDPHFKNQSIGLVSNAFIVKRDLFWAGKILDMNRDAAISCCPRCRSDYLRRVGDVMLESREPAESLAMLSSSLEEGDKLLDDEDLGRIHFLRGIAQHHAGRRGQALADAGRTLREMPIDAPRGYFVDTAAFIAFFVMGGDDRDDEEGLELLEEARLRTRGQRGWKEMRTRSSWVAGHLHARLGHVRRARYHLRSAFDHLLTAGFERESAAVTVDLVQLGCRHPDPREDYTRSARRTIDRCLRKRRDLSEDHRAGLTEMQRILKNWPSDAFTQLQSFRTSIVSPVPPLLGERLSSEH